MLATIAPEWTPAERAAKRRAEYRAIDAGDHHGVPRQLNMSVLDVDSTCTDFGRHNRLIAFRGIGAEARILTVREDVTDLPYSTDADRRRIIAADWGRVGRLTFVSSESYESRMGECIEHTYRIGGK